MPALADPSEDSLEPAGPEGQRLPRGVTQLSALPALVDDFAATVPGEVSVEHHGLGRTVPPQVVLAVSRLLTESLTNVRRHAMSAATVEVRLSAADSCVQVEVVDDGTGGGLGPGNSSGLTGLSERVSLLGGTLMSGPGPTGGWRVHAVLPSSLPRQTGRGRHTSSRTVASQSVAR